MTENGIITLNRKITELKKKILLSDGQKKAYRGEWEDERKNDIDLINELKKSVKELTSKLTYLNNTHHKKQQKQPQDLIKKIKLPSGCKTIEDAVHNFDLKVIDLRKQLDLLHDKYLRKQRFFNRLVEEYQNLLATKQAKENLNNININEPTLEDDTNKKLICHLENEIHRTTVQWMESEHIRKKYRSIKTSLVNDAEKFESSLHELENAISEQHNEIKKLQDTNSEALLTRDTTKQMLQRQEQTAHCSNRARDRQSTEFRRQVEERKMELERLERKIFASGGKTVLHQDSVGSVSGDILTGQTDEGDDAQAQHSANILELTFRKLMVSTGATATDEVLPRFLSQKEATTRLSYLRNAMEGEKKSLENQRDNLTSHLEAFKFADIKEHEVNQEEVEMVKMNINNEKLRKDTCEQESEHTRHVIGTIKDYLYELVIKLQEIDIALQINSNNKRKINDKGYEFGEILPGNIPSDQLLRLVEDKLRLGLMSSGQMLTTTSATAHTHIDDSGLSEDDNDSELRVDDMHLDIPSPSPHPTLPAEEKEKPPPYPPCYTFLIGGRPSAIQSISPGQTNQAVASDDEGDVPSRGYLKRQAQIIVDAKSRRKGFRMPAQNRR